MNGDQTPFYSNKANELRWVGLPLSHDFAETIVALQEAISDLKAGDSGTPFQHFDQQFRERHGL